MVDDLWLASLLLGSGCWEFLAKYGSLCQKLFNQLAILADHHAGTTGPNQNLLAQMCDVVDNYTVEFMWWRD